MKYPVLARVLANASGLTKEMIEPVLRYSIGSPSDPFPDYDNAPYEIVEITFPDKFRSLSGPIYRGEGMEEKFYERLIKTGDMTYGISWTLSKQTAIHFATDNDRDLGVVFEYRPPPSEVVVSLPALLEDPEFMRLAIELGYDKATILDSHFKREEEVILKKPAFMTEKNIVQTIKFKDSAA